MPCQVFLKYTTFEPWNSYIIVTHINTQMDVLCMLVHVLLVLADPRGPVDKERFHFGLQTSDTLTGTIGGQHKDIYSVLIINSRLWKFSTWCPRVIHWCLDEASFKVSWAWVVEGLEKYCTIHQHHQARSNLSNISSDNIQICLQIQDRDFFK